MTELDHAIGPCDVGRHHLQSLLAGGSLSRSAEGSCASWARVLTTTAGVATPSLMSNVAMAVPRPGPGQHGQHHVIGQEPPGHERASELLGPLGAQVTRNSAHTTTLRTSSSVVSPAIAFSNPSRRSVVIPG